MCRGGVYKLGTYHYDMCLGDMSLGLVVRWFSLGLIDFFDSEVISPLGGYMLLGRIRDIVYVFDKYNIILYMSLLNLVTKYVAKLYTSRVNILCVPI